MPIWRRWPCATRSENHGRGRPRHTGSSFFWQDHQHQRGQRPEQKRDEEPDESAAVLALRQPGVDERQRWPADVIKRRVRIKERAEHRWHCKSRHLAKFPQRKWGVYSARLMRRESLPDFAVD